MKCLTGGSLSNEDQGQEVCKMPFPEHWNILLVQAVQMANNNIFTSTYITEKAGSHGVRLIEAQQQQIDNFKMFNARVC